jgi:hypothetical protein
MTSLRRYGPAIVTIMHALFVASGVYNQDETLVPFLIVWAVTFVLYARRSDCQWTGWGDIGMWQRMRRKRHDDS